MRPPQPSSAGVTTVPPDAAMTESVAPAPGGEQPALGAPTAESPASLPQAQAACLPGGAPREIGVPGYEVLEVLGEGGMGVVYQARQEGLNRIVALKRIRRACAEDATALGRFRAEAEAVARLAHPHIVGVYAWGEHDGVPYFALEFCSGGSLDRRLQGRPQPPAEAARLVEKLARAVQAAHEAGIVHRDLKPANVLLAPAGDEPALNTLWGIPKVADFGLCRLLQADGQRTADGAVAGSPLYMAPEQAEGRMKEIGPATDVWALGAILYEMLTGSPPFGGTSLPAILHAVCSQQPPRPGEREPGVPAELEEVCLRCLRKPPGERYARAADLAEALRTWLAEAATTAPQMPGRIAPAPSPGRVGRKVLAAFGVLLLAGLAALGAWALRDRSAPPTPAPPAAEIPAEPKVKPLKAHLRVWRRASEASGHRLLGELGQTTFRVRLNEEVLVEGRLSEPAYAYLLGFNPTDRPSEREQFFPGKDADRPPVKDDRVGPGVWIALDDGQGLQAFVVVASRQPLPAYTEWLRQCPPLRWQRTEATPGVVWLGEDREVDGLFDSTYDRARENRKSDKAARGELLGQLRGMPGVEAVSVMGFAVDAAE